MSDRIEVKDVRFRDAMQPGSRFAYEVFCDPSDINKGPVAPNIWIWKMELIPGIGVEVTYGNGRDDQSTVIPHSMIKQSWPMDKKTARMRDKAWKGRAEAAKPAKPRTPQTEDEGPLKRPPGRPAAKA